MIPLSERKTLIKSPVKSSANLDMEEDGFNIGMNFEEQVLVLELDTDKSTILTLPIALAYRMALKMIEASAIVNFANSVGLSFTEESTEVTTDESAH